METELTRFRDLELWNDPKPHNDNVLSAYPCLQAADLRRNIPEAGKVMV